MNNSKYTCAERVAEGARLLDLVCPEWETMVNLEILDLSSAKYCILGQVGAKFKPEGYSPFVNMRNLVDNNGYGDDEWNSYCEKTSGCESEWGDFVVMKAEWVKLIETRRQAA